MQFFNLLENSFNLLKSRSFIFSEIFKLGFINVNFTPEQDINWFSSICKTLEIYILKDYNVYILIKIYLHLEEIKKHLN